ncbi:MAG: sulfatase-like hydrolase/transferase [Fidelibacterota bacterium]|nr:MAG: sulfatase-like hydrolase/transferase [Candidatus Neomarinimicrobiota bacterium]
MDSKWHAFVTEFIKQLQAYLFAVVYLGLFRIVLIAAFHNKIATGTGAGDLLLTIAHGFRFDSIVAAWFLLVPFLANLALSPFALTRWSAFLRHGFSGLLLFAITLTSVVTIPYFKEYDSQFDFWVFEAFYDDRRAIMRTILEDYHLFTTLLILAVVSAFCIFLLGRWQRLPLSPLRKLLTRPGKMLPRGLIVFLMVLLTFAALRGSFKSRPAMRKWADVTADSFLNKTVMNPIKHLQYAYEDFRSVNSQTRGVQKLLGDMSVAAAAQEYFSLTLSGEKALDLKNYLLRTAPGSRARLPEHIFVLVMEGYDSWPLLPEYSSLQIAEGLKTIAAHGVHFNHFLPAGSSTMASLAAILAGIPHTGVNISRIGAREPPFITSSASIFERLGYKTRLYYGGFLSWQNIGNLFRAQGFDETLASPNIEQETSDPIWGVEDEQLFDFILANTRTGERTFNIIMTTSYHPPFSIDVKSKGFQLEEVPADVVPYFDGSMTLNQLGHIWYCDQEIARFVRAMEQASPSSLFAITGDHYGRRFLNARPSIYERSSVPFILYGHQFVNPRGTPDPTPGSHIDIVPTIVDLIAPAGFQYYSFGRSMFEKGEKAVISGPNRVGIGHRTIIADHFIANLKIDRHPAPLPDADFISNMDLLHDLKARHDQLIGLGWWLIFRGDSLEAATPH